METLTVFRRFAIFASVLLLAMATPKAMATHLRGGSLSWRYVSSTSSAYTVEFTLEASQRWSYPGTAGTCPNNTAGACPALNATVILNTWSGGTFTYGDGGPQTSIS